MNARFLARAVLFLLAGAALQASERVVITEIMYHPASEDPAEEFIELYNAGSQAVSLAGWRLDKGVSFRFPDVALPVGGYLVVAADLETFSRVHPGVTNAVGNWEGMLSNSGETIELVDDQGRTVQSLFYADEGDWARRELGEPDHGHRGWVWVSPADGGGASIECVNPFLPNANGQNWAPSAVDNGTPGRANSVARADIAPLILDVANYPIVPRSTDRIAVTARIVDEVSGGLDVALFYRRDGETSFAQEPMADDGAHEDGAPGDGVFGALIAPQPDGTVVEFYVRATDRLGQARTWPAPAWIDGEPTQAANALLQVDDLAYTGALPLYRLILRQADRDELRQINRNSPSAPYSTSDQTRSHACFNATFISRDARGSCG